MWQPWQQLWGVIEIVNLRTNEESWCWKSERDGICGKITVFSFFLSKLLTKSIRSICSRKKMCHRLVQRYYVSTASVRSKILPSKESKIFFSIIVCHLNFFEGRRFLDMIDRQPAIICLQQSQKSNQWAQNWLVSEKNRKRVVLG